MNRILTFMRGCCPDCLARQKREQLLDSLRAECNRVERLAGGIIDFWLPKADCLDDDGDGESFSGGADGGVDDDEENRELTFIDRAKVRPIPVTAITIEKIDVAEFAVGELRRLGMIYLHAADAIEDGRVYQPPTGTLKHGDDDDGDDDDDSGDLPVESDA